MTFAHPPRTRAQRMLHRAPIGLFRLGIGGIFGGRLLMLTHTGRTSGRRRRVVLEVVGRHERTGGYLIASGYGSNAQWYRNIIANPRITFRIARHDVDADATVLPPDESGELLARYAAVHPRAAKALMRTIGQHTDGSPQAYRRIGSDPDHGTPLVALVPRSPPG